MDCSVPAADGWAIFAAANEKRLLPGVGRRHGLGVPVMIVALFFKGR